MPRVQGWGLLEGLLLFQSTMEFQFTCIRPHDTTQKQCTSFAGCVTVMGGGGTQTVSW